TEKIATRRMPKRMNSHPTICEPTATPANRKVIEVVISSLLQPKASSRGTTSAPKPYSSAALMLVKTPTTPKRMIGQATRNSLPRNDRLSMRPPYLLYLRQKPVNGG